MNPRLLNFLISAIAMLVLFAPLQARAEDLTIAAAADLTFAFKDITPKFQQQTGNKVRVSYGSSGNFFSQIKNGAPYDLFFSADVQYPQKLADAGLVERDTIYEYAAGKIVIWVPSSSKLDFSPGLKALLHPAIRKIAIANPAHAPYGRAAVAALQHEGIYDRIQSKLVLGEDISQTAQFVQSGNVDVGIIALSLALAPTMKDRGRFALIPAEDYPPIIQAACVIKASKQGDLARKFLEFIKQPVTTAEMGKYGFTLPDRPAASSPK